MRWTPGGMSSDIDDERDSSGGGGFGFGGYGPHLGIGGTIILLVLSLIFRTNLFRFVTGGPAATTTRSAYRSTPAANDREAQFVSFVLDDVQKTWDRLLPDQTGVPYHHAKLVLYRDSYPSACGMAQTATGPFYCPADEKVYLDLGFYDELRERFGAPGEFAQAYVIAHEIGHHVQKLLGIEGKVQRLRQQDPEEANP
ncbi:MAG TPA: neutral zinc metallopeptidase, partial [Bryobacteraceae bacterium]|nr:neutral zinc metallopeptidase [Bryobacteraceae bacterium]